MLRCPAAPSLPGCQAHPTEAQVSQQGGSSSHSRKLLYEQDQFHPHRNAGNYGVISVLVAVRTGNEARRRWKDSTNYTFRLGVGGCGIDDPPLNQTGALIKLRQLLRTPRKLSKFYIQNKRPFPMPLEDSSCSHYSAISLHSCMGRAVTVAREPATCPPPTPPGAPSSLAFHLPSGPSL